METIEERLEREKISTQNILGISRAELELHPFVKFTTGFNNLAEIANFPFAYRQEYDKVVAMQDDLDLNDPFIFPFIKTIKMVMQSIEGGRILTKGGFIEMIVSVISRDYLYLLAADNVTEEDYGNFEQSIAAIISTYKDFENFNELWALSPLSKVSKYVLLPNNTETLRKIAANETDFEELSGIDLSLIPSWDLIVYFTLNREITEHNRILLGLMASDLENGIIRISDHNFLEVLEKMLGNIIPIPYSEDNRKRFLALDAKFSNEDFFRRVKVENSEQLMMVMEEMQEYCNYLFSIKVPHYLKKSHLTPENRIEKDAFDIHKKVFKRIEIFREFYINLKNQIYSFEGSPFIRVVQEHFKNLYSKAKTLDLQKQLQEDIESFYKLFNRFHSRIIKGTDEIDENLEFHFLDEYLKFEITDKVVEQKKLLPQIRIGKEVIPYDPSTINTHILDLIKANKSLFSDQDLIQISEKLKGKVKSDLIDNVIQTLLHASPNLEEIQHLVDINNGRFLSLSKIGNEKSKGGDLSISVSIINDGHPNPNKRKDLCAIIFVTEFVKGQNIVKILVKRPEDIKVDNIKGKEEPSYKEFEKQISDTVNSESEVQFNNEEELPQNIREFLRKNKIPGFSIELSIESFQESVAIFIETLLKKDQTYSDSDEKKLIEEFLGLCIDNSEIQESILVHLSQLVQNRSINITFSSKRSPENILSFRSRIIARNILSYLAGKEKQDSMQYVQGFTQSAKDIYEAPGITPIKQSATKEWLDDLGPRIHICRVKYQKAESDQKLEQVRVVITWNNHD